MEDLWGGETCGNLSVGDLSEWKTCGVGRLVGI